MELLFIDGSPVRKRDSKKFNNRNRPVYYRQAGALGPINYPDPPLLPSFSNCYCPPPGVIQHGYAPLDPNCPPCPYSYPGLYG